MKVIATRHAQGAPNAEAPRPVVRPRRSLPGSRAVFGGFLVAVAVVGTVAAQAAGSGPPSTRYVVAAAPLPAGRSLKLDDLTTRPIDLPEPLARHTYHDPNSLVGRVLAATLAEGELVQGSALAQRGPAAGEREVSFTADPARSLGQRLAAGDLVDVYATAGQSEGGATNIVVRSARLIDRQGRDGGGGYIFTVALANTDDIRGLVTAAAAGSLAVVRATAAQQGREGG